MFNKALKELPKGITHDHMEHTTIEDLCFLVQHELDILNEEPEHYEHMSNANVLKLKKGCEKFLVKYKK